LKFYLFFKAFVGGTYVAGQLIGIPATGLLAVSLCRTEDREGLVGIRFQVCWIFCCERV